MTNPGKRDATLTSECHVDYNVRAFVAASDRVRYVLIAITVASILIFTGHHNAHQESWFNSRLDLARSALSKRIWEQQPHQLKTPKEKAAWKWADARQLRTEDDVRKHIEFLEESRIDQFVVLQMPVFGVKFDVNDLGLLGGISFSILLLMLTFAMARQSENLYLSLWKVREIWRLENFSDNPSSAANLVYHSLAMSQHFSNPPTLARWKVGRLRNLTNILLVFPLAVQGWGLWRDWSTQELGLIVNRQGTIVSLGFQIVTLALTIFLTAACYLFVRANDLRWNNTFLLINQRLVVRGANSTPLTSLPRERLKAKEVAPWLVWVKVRRPEKIYYPEESLGGEIVKVEQPARKPRDQRKS